MRSFKYYKVLNPRHVLSERNPILLYRIRVRSGFQSGTIRIDCGTKWGSKSQFVIAIRSSFRVGSRIDPERSRAPDLSFVIANWSSFRVPIRIDPGTKWGSGSQFVIAIRSSFRVRSRIDPGTKSGRRSQFAIANWSSFRIPIRTDPDRLRNEVGLRISV